MIEAIELSLIVPAHNEEDRLPATLRQYAVALREAYGSRFEIIVVSNGSTDGTATLARETRRRIPEVRTIEIAEPIGKGGAVLEGFRRARGRRLVFTDADGATAPRSLLELAAALDTHPVVIGSRRLDDSVITRRQGLSRRVLSRTFAAATRLLFGLPYPDTQCGAKAFRADVARQLVDHVSERHWTFDLDVLLTCRRFEVEVAQIGVEWADQAGSRLRVVPTLRMVVPSLWRLWRMARSVSSASASTAPLESTPAFMAATAESALAGEPTYETKLAHSRV